MGRPKKAEKYSAQAQKDMLRELCGDAITLMQEHLKALVKKQKEMAKQNQVMNLDFQSLGNFVSKMLPIITDENTQSEDDVTMEILCKKAVKVNLRIQEANEEGLKEEEDEPKKN